MQNLAPVLTTFLVLTPVVTGVVEFYKGLYPRKTKYAPVAALVSGILLAWVASTIVPGLSWGVVILGGLVLGLSSSGLYSGTKAVTSQ